MSRHYPNPTRYPIKVNSLRAGLTQQASRSLIGSFVVSFLITCIVLFARPVPVAASSRFLGEWQGSNISGITRITGKLTPTTLRSTTAPVNVEHLVRMTADGGTAYMSFGVVKRPEHLTGKAKPYHFECVKGVCNGAFFQAGDHMVGTHDMLVSVSGGTSQKVFEGSIQILQTSPNSACRSFPAGFAGAEVGLPQLSQMHCANAQFWNSISGVPAFGGQVHSNFSSAGAFSSQFPEWAFAVGATETNFYSVSQHAEPNNMDVKLFTITSHNLGVCAVTTSGDCPDP